MRIDLRDDQRRPVGRVMVDPAVRPTRVTAEAPGSRLSALGFRHHTNSNSNPNPNPNPNPNADGRQPMAESPAREVFLNWETAVDDSGQLRRCIACGCTDLFKEKAFPQVTAIIVVLAFIGAIVGAVGWASTPVLYGMLIILVFDVAILVLSRRRLVCYRCRSAFRDLPIARYHRSWDRAVADRHPLPPRTIPAVTAVGIGEVPADALKPDESSTTEPTTNYFASG